MRCTYAKLTFQKYVVPTNPADKIMKGELAYDQTAYRLKTSFLKRIKSEDDTNKEDFTHLRNLEYEQFVTEDVD